MSWWEDVRYDRARLAEFRRFVDSGWTSDEIDSFERITGNRVLVEDCRSVATLEVDPCVL